MGFRSIVGRLDFPDGNSAEWLKRSVVLAGVREVGSEHTPPMSSAAFSEVDRLSFDVGQTLPAKGLATVREQLDLAEAAGWFGEVIIEDDFAEFRVSTQTTDPDLISSVRVLLCFCAGVWVGATGNLYAVDAWIRGSEVKRTFGLAMAEGTIVTWLPRDKEVKAAVRASNLGHDLPSLAPGAYAVLR
jgi:hypothetical protein